ncbi:zinc finger MYM-type protein 1-like [Salvia splendens]|uniref:zinc finger MYM-type protein 1-like n=1 Tax=Salvia splendens TaxID=180675 RepID=UPI001C26D8FB|nr:zinc finger MYM-type protein 1-like [Salvia splendens]
MERFFKKKRRDEFSSPSEPIVEAMENQPRREVGLNLNDIVGDPGKRKPIEEFDVSIRDRVRREYLNMGPCQPIGHKYEKKKYGTQERSFQDIWFKRYTWLEYSVSKDAAFCFWCYLFKKSDKWGRQSDDAFTKTGCSNWKNALERFNYHVGGVNSCHSNARIQFEAFQDQRNSVASILRSNTREMEVAYRIRLTVSLNVTRFLLKQGLSFRGHDESSSSSNRGNFIELLLWFSELNDDVSKTLFANAPANNQMNSPRIQKELANACASEVTLAIVNDIGDKVFTLLVDEARDVSMKEQMGVVLRYVNNEGYVIERFIGIVHVTDTSSHTLKCAIDDLLVKHNLSLSKVRGQGYDGASNMRGEFNGLKSLILQENPYAMYIHCLSHQLQLIIVAVAKGIRVVKDVFSYVSMIVNMVGASCKRKDQLRQLQHDRLVEQLNDGELISGRGKNQETSLVRPGDTRWGSHYFTLLRLCSMWSSVEKVSEVVRDDATLRDNRSTTEGLIERMDNYEFVFTLHLMKHYWE